MFWKCSKFNVDFEKAQKNSEKAFCFWEKCIWIACIKLSLLKREYLSSAINVLTKFYKVLDITKTDIFQPNYLQNEHSIWWRCCREDCNSVCAHLPCCLSKGAMKQDFLDLHLTTFFEVRNFENTSAMRVNFFFKMCKI